MLKVVDSEPLKYIFDKIWMKVYKKYNYDLEEFQGNEVVRFVVKHKKHETYVGTIEVVFNYAKNGLEYERLFSFSSIDEIRNDLEHTVIIQKVSILPEYQSEGYLGLLLYSFAVLNENTSLRYGIAFIEPILFVSLKRIYKVSILKCGDKFFYKGDEVLPVLIDIADTIGRIKELPWIKSLKEKKLITQN